MRVGVCGRLGERGRPGGEGKPWRVEGQGRHQACRPKQSPAARGLFADRRSDQHGDGIAVGEMSERGGGQQRTCQPFWPSWIHGAAAGVILPASPMECLLLPYRPTLARLPLPARAGVLGHSISGGTWVIGGGSGWIGRPRHLAVRGTWAGRVGQGRAGQGRAGQGQRGVRVSGQHAARSSQEASKQASSLYVCMYCRLECRRAGWSPTGCRPAPGRRQQQQQHSSRTGHQRPVPPVISGRLSGKPTAW